MPRNCTTCCVSSYVPRINNVGTQAFANMGYVGFVQLESALLLQLLGGSVLGQTLRVTDFGMGLSQAIEKPDVIDGRIDRTVYQLGPKEVEGTMAMPLIVETYARDTCPSLASVRSEGENSEAGKLIKLLWCWATSRSPEGRMAFDDVALNVRYANHAAFRYNLSMVNELTLRATQGDLLGADLNIMARSRIPLNASPYVAASGSGLPSLTDYLSPARVLTWNDLTITGITGCSGLNPGSVLFYSNTIRDWTLVVANNLDRFYTFNGSLFPSDINAGVRDVTGTLEFMGLNDLLREHTSGSTPISGLQSHFTEKNELRFAFYIGEETYGGGAGFAQRDWVAADAPYTPIFARRLLAVIYEIEEMSLSNDLYVTTVNYHAMATDDDAYYEFCDPATSYFPAWYVG